MIFIIPPLNTSYGLWTHLFSRANVRARDLILSECSHAKDKGCIAYTFQQWNVFIWFYSLSINHSCARRALHCKWRAALFINNPISERNAAQIGWPVLFPECTWQKTSCATSNCSRKNQETPGSRQFSGLIGPKRWIGATHAMLSVCMPLANTESRRSSRLPLSPDTQFFRRLVLFLSMSY